MIDGIKIETTTIWDDWMHGGEGGGGEERAKTQTDRQTDRHMTSFKEVALSL